MSIISDKKLLKAKLANSFLEIANKYENMQTYASEKHMQATIKKNNMLKM